MNQKTMKMAKSITQNERHYDQHNNPRSNSTERRPSKPQKIAYRSGPDYKVRTKRNQIQQLTHKGMETTESKTDQKTNKFMEPMTYVRPRIVKNKRINPNMTIKKLVLTLHMRLYSKIKQIKHNHSQYFYCTAAQSKITAMVNKTSKGKSSTKSPYQEMLQRGIDGYMAEKQPNSNNTNKVPSGTPGNETPPLSNSTTTSKSTNEYESEEEETEEERNKRIEEDAEEEKLAWDTRHDSLTEEEKRLHDEDEEIIAELEKDRKEREKEEMAKAAKENESETVSDKETAHEGNDLTNKHGPQAKLDQIVAPKTAEERLLSLRSRAKALAENKRIEKELQTQKLQSKKKQKVQKPKKTKANKKKEAETALKDAEKTSEDENKANESEKEKTTKQKENEEVIEVEEENHKENDKGEVEHSEDDDDSSDEEYDGANNPYSVQALQARKKKNAKREKKMMKKIQRPYNTYYTLKLKINKNDNPMEELVNSASKWFTGIQDVDKDVIIYGFKDNMPTHGIHKPSDIPQNIVAFKEFFLGANPISEEGYVWTNIWIGHALDTNDIYANFKFWLKKNGTAMYIKKLQEKHTIRDYFLLWSSSEMCPNTMHKEVTNEISKITKEKYKFAFVWSVIRREDKKYKRNENANSQGKQYVRALHIEVPKDKAELTYRMLSRFFGSQTRKHILFRRTRMVPVLRASFTTRAKEKIGRLIELQKSYSNRIESAQFYDLNGGIDIVRDDIKKSMRQIIMELRSLDGTDQLVFTSIDYDEYTESYKLTFPTALKSHAYDYMAQLSSFLEWVYGEKILKLFTDAAVEKAKEAPWSEEEMCAVSRQDMDLDAFADDMKNFEWMADCENTLTGSILAPEDVEQVRKTEAFLFKRATDDGSISTFNHKKGNRTKDDNETNKVNDKEASPTKKQRTNSGEVMDIEMTNENGRQIQTLEIMLSTKDQEILSLRQRLEALSASGVDDSNNINKTTPDLQDRSPSNHIGLTPGLETDPGDNL